MSKNHLIVGGITSLLLVGIIFAVFGLPSFTDVAEVKGADKIWTESTPIETEATSTGNIGDQYTVIDSYQESDDSGWQKTDDGRVFWENNIGYVEVDPHTCNSFHCKHNWKIVNKDASDQTINVGFILSDNQKNPSLYRLETVTKERPTYEEETYEEEVYNNQTEELETIERTRMVENGTEEYEVQEYVNRNSAFSSTEIDGDKAYYTTGYIIKADSTQEGYFEYDNKITRTQDGYESSGKWEMVLWTGDYQSPTWSLRLDPWFDTDFGKRFLVTINSSEVDSDLTDFPVFFNLSDAPSEFWSSVDTDGDDIVVTQGEDVQVPRELVHIDTTNEHGELWFKGNLSSSSDSEFYIYYDNPSATETNDPDTWRSEYLFVLHLQDTGVPALDSTSNGRNSTDVGSSNPTFGAVGHIYDAVDIEKSGSEYLNIPDDAGMDTLPVTMSAWIELESSTARGSIIARYEDADPTNSHSYLVIEGNNEIMISGEGSDTLRRGNVDDGEKALIHGVITSAGTNSKIYKNGTQEGTSGTITVEENSNNPYRVGATANPSAYFDGIIDEVRVYAGELSADWIASEYSNQNNPTNFYTVGSQEVNFGLEVNLDAPTDNFINTTTGDTPFKFTPLSLENSTAFFINASLYHNESGTFSLISSNTTELVNNTQETILDTLTDGIYLWNIELCGDDGGEECFFADNNFTYIVQTNPIFSNINITPNGTQNYQTTFGEYNLSVFDDSNNTDVVLVEHNLTGSLVNYTMSLLNFDTETGNYTLEQSIEPATGNYSVRFIANDTAGNINTTSTFTIEVEPISSDIDISSSSGLVVVDGDSSTITCTVGGHVVETPTLKIDSVTVSNPTTRTFSTGSYNLTCSIPNTNYTDTSKTSTLTSNPVSLCTNSETFGFRKIVTSGSGTKSWDFSQLVSNSQVEDNLTDVYIPNATDTSIITKVINSTHNILTVNESTLTGSYFLEFGNNFFANRSYSDGSVNETSLGNVTGFSQINPTIDIRMLDEIDFVPLHPPNATVDLFVNCDLGESHVEIPEGETNFLIALANNDNLKLLEQIKYDASTFYSRQYYPPAQDSTVSNIYLVDATAYPLSRIDFRMADFDLYDSHIEIYRTIGNSTIIFTEGFFDQNHKFSAYLREDADYFVRTILGSSTTDFGIKTVVQPEEVILRNIKLGLSSDAVLLDDSILMNAVMSEDRTNLTVQYNDALLETTNVTVTIYHENGTVFDQTTYFTDSITAVHNTTDLTEETLTVVFEVEHERYGNSPIKQQITLFADALFDLGITNTYLYTLFAVALLIGIGALVTRSSLLGGIIILPIMTGIMTGIGWIDSSIGYGLTAFITIIGILAFAHEIKTRGEP